MRSKSMAPSANGSPKNPATDDDDKVVGPVPFDNDDRALVAEGTGKWFAGK